MPALPREQACPAPKFHLRFRTRKGDTNRIDHRDFINGRESLLGDHGSEDPIPGNDRIGVPGRSGRSRGESLKRNPASSSPSVISGEIT